MNSRFLKRSKIKGLVLSLKQGDLIAINSGELLVEIIEVRGSRARVAFKAAKDISISRLQIAADKKQLEN